MADTPAGDPYPKGTVARAEVEAIAANHLANGAISSVITETDTDWILTTVWAGGSPPSSGD
jgi:hypothetical protein